MLYNNPIPTKIMTPDTVETRLGTLKFVDGVPTAETTQLVFDNLDFMRGTEVFLNFVPACSIEAIRLSFIERGAGKSNQAVIFDDLCDSNPLLLTANTDTVYCIALLDLETDGPTVVEIPPHCGPGTVNDAFFRFVVDMGAPGPDRGAGGKYLIVPDWYQGELPKDKREGGDYFIARSPSKINERTWMATRSPLLGRSMSGTGEKPASSSGLGSSCFAATCIRYAAPVVGQATAPASRSRTISPAEKPNSPSTASVSTPGNAYESPGSGTVRLKRGAGATWRPPSGVGTKRWRATLCGCSCASPKRYTGAKHTSVPPNCASHSARVFVRTAAAMRSFISGQRARSYCSGRSSPAMSSCSSSCA